MSPDLLLLALALAFGFALPRASLCTVAGVRRWVIEGDAAPMLGIAVTSSAAGIVLLASAWLWPVQVMVPVNSTVWPSVVAGGVLLGLGALINGACYLGSVTYLGGGNLNFLFTLLGLGAGLRFVDALPDWSTVMVPASRLSMQREIIDGLLTFAVVLAIVSWLAERGTRVRWTPAVLCGVLAGALYAQHPNWSYGSVIDALVNADNPPAWTAYAAAIALFIGAILSAWVSQRGRLVWPSLKRAARCFAGGVLMAWGAALIPGGNDNLLLWSIPGLALHALVAYASMVATIAALAWAQMRGRKQG